MDKFLPSTWYFSFTAGYTNVALYTYFVSHTLNSLQSELFTTSKNSSISYNLCICKREGIHIQMPYGEGKGQAMFAEILLGV